MRAHVSLARGMALSAASIACTSLSSAMDHPRQPLSKWAQASELPRDPLPFGHGTGGGWVSTQRWNLDASYASPSSPDGGGPALGLSVLERRRCATPSRPSLAAATPGSKSSVACYTAYRRSRNELKLPLGMRSDPARPGAATPLGHFSRRDAGADPYRPAAAARGARRRRRRRRRRAAKDGDR